jgi:lysophospholipase L1-like esterase
MTARRRRAVALLLAVAAAGPVAAMAQPGAVGAQQRRVVVVGDSVILGARAPMTEAFLDRGWDVTFDAAVSRSTAEGFAAIESHRPVLTDTLVVSLGANDAGDTSTFRRRAQAILDATAGVPHVVWVTIREVRGYYGPANQAVREVAAGRPNVTVLDWHAATAGATDLTAGDGLHLNGAGATRMTQLVIDAVIARTTVATPAPPPPTTAPTTTAPTTTAPTTTAPTTTVAAAAFAAVQPAEPSPGDSVPIPAVGVGGALALVVVALGGTRAARALARRDAGPEVASDTQQS